MKSRRGHHETVIAALQKVAAILKEAKVDFAVADGSAGWARAGTEPGDDADVFLAPRDLSSAVRALKEAGLKVKQPPEDWLRKVYVRHGGGSRNEARKAWWTTFIAPTASPSPERYSNAQNYLT